MIREETCVRFYDATLDVCAEAYVESADPTAVDIPADAIAFDFLLIASQEVECRGVKITMEGELEISPRYYIGWEVLTAVEFWHLVHQAETELGEELAQDLRNDAEKYKVDERILVYKNIRGNNWAIAHRPYDPQEHVLVSTRAVLDAQE